jgi:Tol biopolymer transport system component
MRKRRTIGLLLVVPFFLAGCFPIELDVNGKGEMLIYRQEGFFLYHPASGKVTRVAGTGGGVPVFARFSPNGKDALCVVKDGRHAEEFRFDLVRLDGTGARTLCRAENAAYASFSPDGAQLAILHGSRQKQPQIKKRKGEFVMGSTDLEIVEVSSGGQKALAQHLAVSFRWFRDGKRLLVFQFSDVAKDQYLGAVGELEVATGTFRPLVAAVCPGAMMLDLSPDEQTVLFTAHATGRPGESLDPDKKLPPARLYECNVKGGAVRERTAFSEETLFARYSPNGKKILLASPAKGNEILSRKVALGVTDAQWKKFTLLVDNATEGEHGTAGGLAIPGWIGDDTVYYFVERSTYGTSGKSFSLYTAKADGSKKQLVQPVLDRSAFEALETFPEVEPAPGGTPLGLPDRLPSEGGFPPRPDRAEGGNVTVLVLGIGTGVVVLAVVLALVLRRPATAKPKRRALRRDTGADAEEDT